MSIMTTEEFVDLMMRWGNFKARFKSDFAKSGDAKKNRELKDKHKGKRCFVIGNGESIKEQDLSLLKDEITFVVNGFYRYDKYPEILPDYYVIVDPIFLEIEISKTLFGGMDKLKNYDHKPAFAVPAGWKKMIQDVYKWNEWTEIYYLDVAMSFADGDTKPWDITKTVPFPKNAVQVAMLLATYMGVDEINLLGIEQTDLLEVINRRLGQVRSYHAYKEEGRALAVLVENAMQTSLEEILLGYARIFHLYKEIYHLCQVQGIKVYNCTPVSLVNTIPYRNYEEIFSDIKR